MIHSILGQGEVAKNISENIKGDAWMYDKGEWESVVSPACPCDVLHITIPYSDEFVELVIKAAYVFHPSVIIIHSTVKEGTTGLILGKIKKCADLPEIDALYSPIIGRHQDDFGDSTRKFIKYFSGLRSTYDKVADEFDYATQYWGPLFAELEFAKVMSTNYMYWNLVYEKIIHLECKHKGYDPNKVYKRWNRNYNAGYGVDHPEWTRPVYDHVDDAKPGGHCLGENIYLADNRVTEFLQQWHEGRIKV